MTWKELLANNQAKRDKTSKKELDNMRALIARDLADSAIAGLSADRKFATAYKGSGYMLADILASLSLQISVWRFHSA